MNGGSHFALGCACAAAVGYVGFTTGDIALTLSAIAVPVGAMLPDIDHNSTKLGRKRKATMDAVANISKIAAVSGVVLVTAKKFFETGSIISSFMSAVIMIIPLMVCVFLASNKTLKKKFKFFTKHRGIMHTAWPVLGLWYGAISLSGFLGALLMGLSIGYTSHLFADMETTMGCPILWPVYTENIPGIPIRAGSKAEKVILIIDMGVITWLTLIYCGL